VRSLAGIGVATAMAAALAAQTVAPPARVLSVPSRTFVPMASLLGDVADADVVGINEAAGRLGSRHVELAVLDTVAGRRDVILALDAVDRAAQDPLEHFQMDHLSEEEFLAQANVSPATAKAYLPLMKFAVSQRWPIVATGGPGTVGAREIAAPLVQALAIASAGGRRPLLVSLHAGTDRGVLEAVVGLVTAASTGRRAVTIGLEAVRSLETVTLPAAPASSPSYIVYTLTSP
jgi:hypothetical protein